MKRIVTIIFVILLIPIIALTVNAQSIQVDINKDSMQDIENSKYRASGVTITRNAEGQLISVTKVDATRYLDHPIVDRYLEAGNPFLTLVREGELGTNTVKQYRVIAEYTNPICSEILFDVPGFNDKCNWHQSVFSSLFGVTYEGFEYIVFKGLNHNFIVKSGYDVTTYWDIFTRE